MEHPEMKMIIIHQVLHQHIIILMITSTLHSPTYSESELIRFRVFQVGVEGEVDLPINLLLPGFPPHQLAYGVLLHLLCYFLLLF